MKQLIRAGLALGLVGSAAIAQNPPVAQPKAAAPAAAGQAGRAPRAARGEAVDPAARRAQLEQQIRNRIGNQLKNGLKLTDDQFAKLQATNKRFEEKRRLLVEQERDARMGMRDLMIAGDTVNQGKVSAGLDKMLQIQRQRFELIEQEQKELAGFLSPMQRARFLGMQEQMRRRMDDMRAQAGGRRGQNVGPNGPPMGPMGQGMPGMGAPGMGPDGMGQPGMGQPGAAGRQGQRLPRQGVRPGMAQPPVPPSMDDEFIP
ncbi:MAG: Spy/CpxP family protein refolding chaperone [Gemmatimonadota bacterium]|nr:Spy/CpxP family protein refolding chaperone [Gemmatimonadota bacterium]